ncbi:MAG: SusC/RagA family TonB-linked outer membrane protein [Leadbetterella sp.]|nr:SusC/RagA family TonB-linked outer membrane protein [Leadbetterella sp.]
MKKKLLLVFGFLFCITGSIVAQSKTIKGKVTASDDGSAMPGVVVSVKGTSTATQTDASGDYTINASSDQTLVFSFVGFDSVEEVVRARSVINVSLQTDQKLLDEVIVTGVAGATSRKKLTVSVAKVGQEKLSIVPATSAAGALVGKVSGLQTSQRGGSPGAATDLLLRGDNNLNGSSSPLLLVDGIILTGSLADLNVDDIESIEVVKGAAAAALYGSRAGNGVIAVTTKRGANLALNKTDIVVRNEIGAQQLAKYLETSESHLYALASDWQTAQGRYTKYAGVTYPADYAGTGFDPRIVGSRALDADGYMDNPYGVYRDMQRDFFRTGTNLTNFISVANRSEKTNIYLSFENNLQQGVVRLTDGYNRQNFRINLDQQVAKWLRFSATNAFVNRSTSTPSQSDGLFYNIARLEKDVDLEGATNPDGQPYYLRYNHFNEETTNPLYELSKRKVNNNARRWIANYGANVRLTSWADVDMTHTIENENITSGTIYPQDFWTRGGGPIENNYMSYNNGSISKTKSESKTNNSQFTLNLSQKFGDLATRAKLSYLYENRHYEQNYVYGSQFVVSGIENFNNIKPENLTGASSYIEDERAQNYFAILGLDWKDKYLFDGMFRRDGSSLFGPESRWNSYYRVSGAYRISEDVAINGIDELKIRAAHGTAGIRPGGFNWQYERPSVRL